MFLGIKVLLQPTIHFYLTVGSVCVLKWHIWSLLWLKEKLMSTFWVWCHLRVIPQMHQHLENSCPLLAVWLWVKSHLPRFSISDSEGAVSRGMVSVPLPVIDILQGMCWSSAYMLYLHDRLQKDSCHVEWKKGYVCWTDELLASSQYACGMRGLCDFVMSICELQEYWRPMKFFPVF